MAFSMLRGMPVHGTICQWKTSNQQWNVSPPHFPVQEKKSIFKQSKTDLLA
jgi:hypothetical protein